MNSEQATRVNQRILCIPIVLKVIVDLDVLGELDLARFNKLSESLELDPHFKVTEENLKLVTKDFAQSLHATRERWVFRKNCLVMYYSRKLDDFLEKQMICLSESAPPRSLHKQEKKLIKFQQENLIDLFALLANGWSFLVEKSEKKLLWTDALAAFKAIVDHQVYRQLNPNIYDLPLNKNAFFNALTTKKESKRMDATRQAFWLTEPLPLHGTFAFEDWIRITLESCENPKVKQCLKSYKLSQEGINSYLRWVCHPRQRGKDYLC